MNDPLLWIAIGGSVIFVAVLLWKGLWLLRMIAKDPAEGESERAEKGMSAAVQAGDAAEGESGGETGGEPGGETGDELRSAATDGLGGNSHSDQNA